MRVTSFHLTGGRRLCCVIFVSSNFVLVLNFLLVCVFDMPAIMYGECGASLIHDGGFDSVSVWRFCDRHSSFDYGFSSVQPLLISGLLHVFGTHLSFNSHLDHLLGVVLCATSAVDVSSYLFTVWTAECSLYCTYMLHFGMKYTVCTSYVINSP